LSLNKIRRTETKASVIHDTSYKVRTSEVDGKRCSCRLVRPSYNMEHTLRLDSTGFFRNS